jgi:hypothetical protein
VAALRSRPKRLTRSLSESDSGSEYDGTVTAGDAGTDDDPSHRVIATPTQNGEPSPGRDLPTVASRACYRDRDSVMGRAFWPPTVTP